MEFDITQLVNSGVGGVVIAVALLLYRLLDAKLPATRERAKAAEEAHGKMAQSYSAVMSSLQEVSATMGQVATPVKDLHDKLLEHNPDGSLRRRTCLPQATLDRLSAQNGEIETPPRPATIPK